MNCTRNHAYQVASYERVVIKQEAANANADSDTFHHDLIQLATNLDIKLRGLEALFQGKHDMAGIDEIARMRECVQSAATVISTAAAARASDEEVEDVDNSDVKSELEDWDQTPNHEITLDWIRRYVPGPRARKKEESLLPFDFADSIDRVLSPSVALTPPGESRYSVISLSSDYERPVSTPDFMGTSNGTPDSDLSQSKSEGAKDSAAASAPSLPSSNALAIQSKPASKHRRSRTLSNLFRLKRKSVNKTEEPSGPLVTVPRGLAAEIRRKVVFVGDGAAGKTCFLM